MLEDKLQKYDFMSFDRKVSFEFGKRKGFFSARAFAKVLMSWQKLNAGNKLLRIQGDRKMIITAVKLSDIELDAS